MDKLAVNGGNKAKTKEFPQWPVFDEKEKELVNEVFESRNWWRVTGSKVREFERKFARFQGAEFAVGVTNGTDALTLCLKVLEIMPGDEVIIPAMTFISTALSVIECNAVPVLVDVEPSTYCMSVESFEAAITEKTKAVIPVHMAGNGCDMNRICEIAKKNNIFVIEDAAHGHGGEWNNQRLGSYGDAAIFSFQNGKLMTCGEGGVALFRNKDAYEKAIVMQDVGRPVGDKIYRHIFLGNNFRMNEFQAAILLAQIERVDEYNKLREKNAKILNELISKIDGIEPQKRNYKANIVTHYMYMFKFDSSKFGNISRNKFVELLTSEGIPANVCFPIISETEFFRNKGFFGKINYNYNNEHDLFYSRNIANNAVWLHHRTLEGDVQDLEEIVYAISKIQANLIKK